MFCHTCGTELTAGLSFCPRCGANLQTIRSLKTLSKRAELINIWIIANTICGLGLVLGFMKVMQEVGFEMSLIILFSTLVLLTVIAIDAVFIWQILRLREGIQQDKKPKDLNQPDKEMLEEANPAMLYPMPASVTDRTTKNLETVSETRKTKRS